MDKFIKILLEKENTVILPGFGAIVIENENTGKLMFNEYLKFNDGKLDNIIVENSNMSLQEAQNHISKYIKEVQTQLDKGETYDIFELGSFTKDDDGSIEFSGQKPGSTSPKEASTEKKTVAPPEKKAEPVKKVEPKKEEKPKAEEKPKEAIPSKPASDKSEPNKEEKSVPSKNKNESDTKKVTPDATPKDTSKEDNKEKQRKEKEEVRLAKEQAKKEKEQAKAEQKKAKQAKKGEKDPKKKKKAGVLFWVLLFILLLLAGGGIYVGLNYDKVKTYMGWDQFEQEELKKQEIEKAKKEAEAKAKAEKEEKERLAREEEEKRKAEEEKRQQLEEEKAVDVQTQGNFHLIAGAFADKSNADDLVSDLKSKGHPAQIIGVYGQLHFVSVRSFNSRQEARNNAPNVQNDAPGAWVFRK